MERSKNVSGAHLSLSSSTTATTGGDHAPNGEMLASRLDADDLSELSAAIERSLCEGEIHTSPQADIDVNLRKALRVACAKARLQRVRAEQLLVDLKTVWMTLPSMLSTRTEDRLNRIVSACIDEYYSGENSTLI